MNVTLRKIGNSDGVIIPKEMLEQLNVQTGDTLVLTADKDGLRLTRSTEDPEIFEKKMKIARERMKKYETAYRVLAQ
ncbi:MULTISPECIES: AbrB/MazE/SpoVT family DNA-binding domain-containing protein [Brucella/Ochrobactrum group]|uniref:AbrB/MazE/SpoVT family DNA-binding domain-containing protein n=1 Tax=Brucella tritici TaxID=94626 RepID=A0A7V7VQU0_9HYPH|nr:MULTISPECIES: AbrB/MazE/SpoVT family DNA-binding domain-containing protein [Brucella/Ochrobactrum group]KAB2654953.1 AbrB/MazE/SpoVT family DNA-binding domain-containing protein [Brucella tritici]KAB2730330.1 AbrB/MazE/SpoVT family DNA-binding domain-containing protein [Brucella anthropi]KXO74308.1 AbrB family transcriptional regulator [Brucella anthropi]MBQ0709663.1 AbrB/MazE/SpoVT family DNA-binding domain-containing protein [Ochrobactrum sp. AP1BH01-1]MDH0367135.1 AbrB/MazE/SpoVT family 